MVSTSTDGYTKIRSGCEFDTVHFQLPFMIIQPELCTTCTVLAYASMVPREGLIDSPGSQFGMLTATRPLGPVLHSLSSALIFPTSRESNAKSSCDGPQKDAHHYRGETYPHFIRAQPTLQIRTVLLLIPGLSQENWTLPYPTQIVTLASLAVAARAGKIYKRSTSRREVSGPAGSTGREAVVQIG